MDENFAKKRIKCTATTRRKLKQYPTLVYAKQYSIHIDFNHKNVCEFIFELIDCDKYKIINFIPKTGNQRKKLTTIEQNIPILHLSNYISISSTSSLMEERILLDVTEVLHEVDVELRNHVNIFGIVDIILDYYNIWYGVPMQKQSYQVINSMPFEIQWWFVADDEPKEEPKHILVRWISNDVKLYQLVKKISEFDTYSNDHFGMKNSQILKDVTIVQKQYFDLALGKWVSEMRKFGERCSTQDGSWCCRGESLSKNSLYVHVDGLLHLSTWSTGYQVSSAEQELLYKNCKLIQYGGDEIPQMKREVNLLFCLEELRQIFNSIIDH